ncbi:MAG: TetR family transcriptional regulator, partial [Proteobacteria bacterium]|nr:TetR family transcriptional regulator [Pseudomonadota bacterium]
MKGEKKANKTDIRKSQLMAAAFKVIGEKGYSNFTIRDIAQEA